MAGVLAIAACLTLGQCTSPRPVPDPAISITKVPPYGPGNPEELESIEGRVSGAKHGQRIVLYARSGVWWVQPTAAKPFTMLQSGSRWTNSTHPGSAYAALLVESSYYPQTRIEVLPQKGGPVLAVATAQAPRATRFVGKTLPFDGYEWQIRQAPDYPGGTPNIYDPSNAWTDANGFLHLRIAWYPDHWTSAEVNLPRSLGYGTYRFIVRDVSHLEPSAVFTISTWDDADPFREMDMEMSRWGEAAARNGQFVIQPYYVPANSVQFEAPAGPVTFFLRWSPGAAWFKAIRGRTDRWQAKPVCGHAFTSGVPAAGPESVHLNLYGFSTKNSTLRHGTEVVVEKFEYLP